MNWSSSRAAAGSARTLATALFALGLAGPVSGQSSGAQTAAPQEPATHADSVGDDHVAPPEAFGVARPEADSALPPNRRHLLLPLPILFYSEETRWAGGVALSYSYRGGAAEAGAWPSTGNLEVIYTQRQQLIASIGADIYTAGNRTRLAGSASYVHFPDFFYGVGRDLSVRAREGYTSRSVSFATAARRKVRDDFFASGGVSLARFSLLDLTPDGVLWGGTIPGSEGGLVVSGAVGGGVDTRDRLHGTASGSIVSVTLRRSDRWMGSDFVFTQFTVDARQYRALRNGHVLAMQAFGTTSRGDVPFQVLPRMGGPSLMRGYSPRLNRDRDLLAAQTEYRLPLWWRLGGVAFAGAGAVGSGIDDLLGGAIRFSYGGGLRFAIDRHQNLNLRADYGIGRRGSMLYLGIGEAF